MNISKILKLKFPGIDLRSNVVVIDDGDGPYIAKWGLDGDAPTHDILKLWETELESEILFANNKILNTHIYEQLKAIDERSIRALRTNDVEILTQLEEEAEALRAQLLPTS